MKGRFRPRESLLAELPESAHEGQSATRSRRRLLHGRLAVMGVLLTLAAGVGVEQIAVSALAATTGPLTWSAPVLIDHHYPYDNAPPIDSLSCTSSALCVGDTGLGGDIIASTDPSGTSQSDWSVLPTTLLTQSASSYTLDGTSCVTDGSGPFCVVAGFDPVSAGGVVVTTTNPTGGASAFTSTSGPTGELEDPACAPLAPFALCVAASFPPSPATEESLYASSNPAGGAASLTAIPVAGTTNSGGNFVSVVGIACPSANACLAVTSDGHWLSSSNPTSASSWSTPVAITGLTTVESLTCASTSFCLAFGINNADETLTIATTTSQLPTARWTTSTPSGLNQLSSLQISCFPDASVSSHAICLGGTNGPDDDGNPGGLLVSVDGGSTWTAKTLIGDSGAPEAFNCPSSGAQCFIGTTTGAVVTATNVDAVAGQPATTFSAPVGATPGTNELAALACASVTLCVGADFEGNILSETNGAPGVASSWSSVNVDPANSGLSALACVPASTLCVGGDVEGNILTATNAGSGAWSTPKSVDTGGISAIACPSASLCVAVDPFGRATTSTTPAGGGATWSTPAATGDTNELTRVACAPATTFCVALGIDGGLITSTNPATASWSAPVSPGNDTNPLEGVSCPSASLCVAVDDTGDVVTSTNPTGGATAWSAPANIDSAGLHSIDCPSTTLCVAEDFTDQVVVSTNPAGGAATWSAPAPVDPAGALDTLACVPATTTCLGGDTVGDLVVSSPTTAPPPVTSAASSAAAPATNPPTKATLSTTSTTTSKTSVTSTTSTTKAAPLPPPVLGKTENVTPVSGTVLIELPAGASTSSAHSAGGPLAASALSKGRKFIPLSQARQIPVGSILDTTKGTVGITAATLKKNTVYSGDFAGGIFELLQSRTQKGLSDLTLMDTRKRNKVCASVGKRASAAKSVSSKVLGLLKSTVHGSFTTRGGYSSATARGTAWTMTDECAGTLTRVTRDVVSVEDFRTRRTVLVRAGHSFLARASGVGSVGKRR